MALTPNDIVHKEFDTKFRGYDTDQVNDYLDLIVARFEELIQENTRLSQELSVAVDKNNYFAQLQDSLNSSIVVAQEAADRLKQNARKEAELIIFEAERQANDHVSEANEHAQSLIEEVNELKKQNQEYRQNVERLVREQLAFVTSDEFQELFSEDKSVADMKKPQLRSPQSVSEQVDQLVRKTEGMSNEEASEETVVTEETVETVEATTPEDVQSEDAQEGASLDETMVFQSSSQPTQKDTNESGTTTQDFDFSQFDEEPEDRTVNHPKEENEKPKKVQSESVLGETIRIELPTLDEDQDY